MGFVDAWKEGRMRFEDKKFCQIRTLADRWDCSPDRIYDCISKGILLPWHPEGKVGKKGVLVDVKSALKAEEGGYISLFGDNDYP